MGIDVLVSKIGSRNYRASIFCLALVCLLAISITGCDRILSQDAVASPKTQQPPTSIDPTNTSAATPTHTVSPDNPVINPITAPQLDIAAEMLQRGTAGFVWTVGEPEGDDGLALSQENQISLYSMVSLSEAVQIPDPEPSLLSSASKRSVIAWKNGNETVRVWDLASEVELLAIPVGQPPITSLALSSEGNLLALSTSESSIEIWDLSTGNLTHEWELPAWLSDLDFSPDDRFLAGVDPQNFLVYVFEATTGSEVRSFSWTEHASPVLYGAYFSPTWSQLAWVARGSVQLMEVESGDLGPMLSHEDFVSAVAWSPDGSLLASAAGGTVNGVFAPLVYLWDSVSGQRVTTLIQKEPVTSLAFSPDGRELAILDSTGSLYLWVAQE